MSVVLYSTGCPNCKILKKKLDAVGIEYSEENSIDTMLALGITNVPVLSINGELLDYRNAMIYVNELEGLNEKQ